MNNRLIPVIGRGIAASIPQAMSAQAKQPPVVIGWLNADSHEGNPRLLAKFKQGFAALGWKAGVQIVAEERVVNGRGSSRMTERA